MTTKGFRAEGIDLFRFIGAFFIMMLHTEYGDLPETYVNVLRLSGRWAVPFFFIVSGYFLAAKVNRQTLELGRLEKGLFRLISVLLVSSLFYLMLNFYYTGAFFFSISNIIAGTNFHLWFLGSLIFGYILIWYCFMLNKGKYLGWISLLVVLFAILSDSYDVILGVELDYELARFMISLPCLYAGIQLAKMQFPKQWWPVYLLISLFGLGLSIAEAYALNIAYGLDMWEPQLLFGSLIMALGLFAFAASIRLKANALSKMGAQHSLLIYLYHPFVYFLLLVFGKNLLSEDVRLLFERFNPVWGFIVTLSGIVLLQRWLPGVYRILNGDLRKGKKASV
jgi:surface polysaccharide O-acyltransferase-like enzyme